MKISVIVPVYKVEAYLQECVSSVLNQTMGDFEIILVDDGSPDRCPQMCEELAAKDKRIRVIHKENGGLSSARNAGMEIAAGKYLFFLDSDDYLHPQTLELLLQTAEERQCEIVCCNYLTTAERKPSFQTIQSQVPCQVFSREQALEKMYDSSLGMTIIACAKLYRKDLFEGIRYPEGCLHEDEFTTYKLYYRAKQVAYLEERLYYYYQNAQSITHVAYKLGRLAALRALRERLDFFKEKGLEVPYQMTQRLYLIQLMEHYYQVSRLDGTKEILSALKAELKSQRKLVKGNPYFTSKHKLSCLAFCVSPGIFHWIYQAKLSLNAR